MNKLCYFCYGYASKDIKVNDIRKISICIHCHFNIKKKNCQLCGGFYNSFSDNERCLVCMKYKMENPLR